MDWIQGVDNSILLWIRDILACSVFDITMPFISFLGNKGAFWLLLSVFLFLLGGEKRKWGIMILASLAVTALLANVIIKPAVARIRPFDALQLPILIPPPLDYSFPSGHTAAAFAAATAGILQNKKLGVSLFIFAFLMAFSRLYLSVHYPSDVLAGALIGVLSSQLVFKGLNKRVQKNE